MTHSPNQPDQSQHQNEQYNLRNRAVAIGIAALGAAGLLTGTSSAESPNDNPSSLPNVAPIVQNGAENAKIPKDISNYIRHHAVYLDGVGCSGSTITGKGDKIVGVSTAGHCLPSSDPERLIYANNKYYFVQPKPITAKLGANGLALKTVAKLDQFVVPLGNDLTHDVALGVTKGHTPQQAVSAYNKTVLNPVELSKIPEGAIFYSGSWPVAQPDNLGEGLERQTIAGQFLGFGKSNVTASTRTGNKKLNVAWFATSETTDGASATPGASGSLEITKINGKIRGIGPESVFMDLTGQFDYKTLNGSKPNSLAKQGTSISTIAGYTYGQLKITGPHPNAMVVQAVRSEKDIPGYTSPEQAIAAAETELNDASKPKTVIDAIVEVPAPTGARAPLKGGPVVTIKNPMLSRHNGYSVFAWADQDQPDTFNFSAVEDKDLYKVGIFTADPANDKSVNELTTSGALTLETDYTRKTEGDLVDTAGLHVGSQIVLPEGLVSPDFSMKIEDGQFLFPKNTMK